MAVVPLLVLLLTAEVGLRIWMCFADDSTRLQYALLTETPQAARFRPHHYLCYTLQPGYERDGIRHNSLGYRGDEITVPKPKEVYRIAILGGSTTYTEFVRDNKKTFPALLEKLLNQQSAGRRIEVVNAGVPGYSTFESLGNLCFRVLDLEPDLVIIHHGVNDAHCRLVDPAHYRGDNSGRRICWTTPIDVHLLRFSLLARVIGRHCGLWSHPGVDAFVQAPTSDPGTSGPSARIGGDPQEVLVQNPPIYFERNLRSMIGVARANNVDILLTTWAHCAAVGDYAATPHYQQAFAELNRSVLLVAAELNVPCFDFAGCMSSDPQYWRDGRHVNEQGALVKAKHFADFLLASGPLALARVSKGPTEAVGGLR